LSKGHGMSEKASRRFSLSPARLNILELMRLSRDVPLVTAERTMKLAPLAEARRRGSVKISWTMLFLKAFATVAARRPELRRAFMKYPYKHLYEHPVSIGTVIVERECEGERFPLNFRYRKPDRQSLVDLQMESTRCQTVPLEEDKSFRQMRTIGKLPQPLRRLAWAMGYHWSGSKRAHYYGTFGISSPASDGAGLTTIVSPLTCTLHYGMFDDDYRLPMRVTFDHRAIDGAPIARALAEMEQVLLSDMIAEIRQIPAASMAA